MIKNNKLFLVLVVSLLITSLNVRAAENESYYYQNNNNINFTREEYDFLSEFYYEGYQDGMTSDDYERFINSNILGNEIKRVTLYDGLNSSRSSIQHTTENKKLVLTYVCSSTTCTMAAVNTWINSPKVRSYDLIGAYSPTKGSLKFSGAEVSNGSTFNKYTERRQEDYGISGTVKLQDTGSAVRVSMDFTAKKGSTVYVSYQHAKKTISLVNSRKYSFNANGYGGVFLFDSDVSSYYDAMGGVKVSL